MKKFVSIFISLALVFSFASIGLFAEPNNTTAVRYTIEPAYTVVIPETVTAGSDLSITATSVNCEPGYQVAVRITYGIDDSGFITLHRQSGGLDEPTLENQSNILLAQVTLGGGPIGFSTPLALFRGVSTTNVAGTLSVRTPDETGKLAGNYQAILYFDFNYEQIAD